MPRQEPQSRLLQACATQGGHGGSARGLPGCQEPLPGLAQGWNLPALLVMGPWHQLGLLVIRVPPLPTAQARVGAPGPQRAGQMALARPGRQWPSSPFCQGGGSGSWGWLGGKRVVSVLSPGCSGVYIIYTWQMGSSYTLTLCQGRGFDIVLLLFSH